MLPKATDVARAMDDRVRAGPPDDAEKDGTLVKEAYSAIAIAHDRAGDRQAAGGLLDKVLLRDGILLKFVEQRSQALDMDGVRDAILEMDDPFLRGRACYAAARVTVELGPGFDDRSSTLIKMGQLSLERYKGRSERLMRTLLGDYIVCHVSSRTGTDRFLDKTRLLDQIRGFPPEYRVPGWAALAVSATLDGRRQRLGNGMPR